MDEVDLGREMSFDTTGAEKDALLVSCLFFL